MDTNQRLTIETAQQVKNTYMSLMDGLKETRADLTNSIMSQVSSVGTDAARNELSYALTAWVNACLNEAKHVAGIIGGEKYTYDIFLLSLIGKDRIKDAQDAIAMSDSVDGRGTAPN